MSRSCSSKSLCFLTFLFLSSTLTFFVPWSIHFRSVLTLPHFSISGSHRLAAVSFCRSIYGILRNPRPTNKQASGIDCGTTAATVNSLQSTYFTIALNCLLEGGISRERTLLLIVLKYETFSFLQSE